MPALTRDTTDGRLEMTNNAVERAIRPLALTRKNYLFAGSDSGGMRSAAMYTLLESAKMNRLDPEAYLRDVLARIARSIASANSCPGTESRPADAPTSIITYLRHHAVCTLRARANAATVVLQLCARGSRHRQLMRSGLAGRKIKAPWMRITNAGRFTLIN